MTENRKGGRPRTGSLYWTKSGWRARLTVDVDGVSVQKSFDLETTDKQVARIKLRRLVHATQAPPEQLATEAARVETFREAAERIVGESMIRTKKTRLDRLRRHAFPEIGPKLVTEIVAGDVRAILEKLVNAGASKETCIKIRNDIGSVLGELWRNDMLPENVCSKVRIPKNARVDPRERAVLTDEELVRYLAWEHPDEKEREAVRERQTMACVSRMFGGLRLGDIKAIRWEAFDTTDGRFEVGWAPRTKTARPQALVVPEILRPILRDWWERAGRPKEGFVFPVRRGRRAGEQRRGGSPAKALRRDLMRAFGLERPVAIPFVRSNGRPDVRRTWERAREMTPRERELFEETEFTRPVEFHSFRRAFKQALADAGVELQTAMTLSGASDPKTHRRYLNNTAKAREIPSAALPKLSASSVLKPESPSDDFSGFSGGRSRDRTCDFVRVNELASTEPEGFRGFTRGDGLPADTTGAVRSMPCRNAMQKPPRWHRAAADAALAAYLGAMARALAEVD